MELVDFRWWRCLDGYRLEQTHPKRLLPRVAKRDDVVKKTEGGKPLLGEPNGWSLENASARHEEYRPLEIAGLFAIFAEDTPSTPGGMLTFCNRFGIPVSVGTKPVSGPPLRLVIGPEQLLREQRNLRGALTLFQRGDASSLVRYWNSTSTAVTRTELRTGTEGQMELAFAPLDLIQAMWLQFAQFACSGARLFRCERCNSPFVVGSGTGRRGTAKWCSNACKQAAFK
jgi:hypothetical protein